MSTNTKNKQSSAFNEKKYKTEAMESTGICKWNEKRQIDGKRDRSPNAPSGVARRGGISQRPRG